MYRGTKVAMVAITIATTSCGVDAESPRTRRPASSSERHTWRSGQPTSATEPTRDERVECREDFDCCPNPNVPCGRSCADGACVTAPTPPPAEAPLTEESPEGTPPAGEPSDDAPPPADPTPEEPSPPEPTIDLSVASSWQTDDLLDLPDGTPALVRTVLDGFTTTDLAVTLRGFVANPITSDARDPYLLLETDPTDERWVLTNGAAAGMSGSPIIINGRLAGALSFSVGDTIAPFLFVATPIEKMLAVDAASLEVAAANGESDGTPLSAVLTVPSAAAEWFGDADWIDEHYVVIPDDDLGIAGSGTGEAPELVPGSAIAVLVISGDMLNLGGVGTVTAVDGDAIWAFGHPMFGAGPLALPFSGAEVMAVASNPVFGAYKIASPSGTLLGTITEDRNAAIAGRFGALPPLVETRSTSTYGGDTQDVAHKTVIVDDAFDTAHFAVFSVVWPISVQRDRRSSGSIAYDLRVTVGETDLVGHRRDVVSTPFWVEPDLFFDLLFRVAGLIGNSRVPLTLERVELEASVSDDRRELTVDDLDVADEITAGDELVVAVRLLPFGSSEPVTQALVLEIPPDFPSGPATLMVGPETTIGRPELDRAEDRDDGTPETAEDIVAAFNALPRQQVLVARLTTHAGAPAPECLPPPTPAEPPSEEPPAEETGGGGGAPVPSPEPCSTPTAPDSDEPPPPPPHVVVTVELDAAINGFESESIEVSGP